MKYDIAIVGSGPAGYVAALRASALGASVALIEKEKLGGVCLNVGCIPTKAVLASANAIRCVKSAGNFGIIGASDVGVDISAVMDRKDAIVDKLVGGVSSLLKSGGVDVINGKASFDSSRKLSVASDIIDADKIIIATGSSWSAISGLEPDGRAVVTSDDVLSWKRLPSEMLIIGGGVVGCEFAIAMSSFGVDVTIVEAMPSILPVFESALSRLLMRSMKLEGISIYLKTTVEQLNRIEGGVEVTLSSGEEMKFDVAMVSIGRRPNSGNMNIATTGIKIAKNGVIIVDDNCMTNIDGIYAIGDVTGGPMLAHRASAQAVFAVERILGKNFGSFDGTLIPSPVFTHPEIASVGYTSEEIKNKNVEFDTGRFPYAANGRALCDGEEVGQVLVHAEKDGGKVLGVHAFGKDASSIVSEAAVVMRLGCTAKDLASSIHPHPTLSEILSEAAADAYGAAIHKANIRKKRRE